MRGIQSLHPTQPTGLLDVPLEIRLEIYRYFLIQREPIKLHFLGSHTNHWPLNAKRYTVVLLVSRQLSEEVLDVLYGENVFEVTLDWGSQRNLSQFAPANRQRIRRLQLLPASMTFPTAQPEPSHLASYSGKLNKAIHRGTAAWQCS